MKYSIKYKLNGETLYAIKSNVAAWLEFMQAQGLEIEVLEIQPVRAAARDSGAAA